ncbi:ABC-type branched-chain amino acid transport system, periplasmic component [Sphaerochaeta pleomorpha str. Grapes]|uniref:ABC-type branched-chain amino acid transport system, periplasmic component n=1 Tax=Sphaerochaeta pleomorpha (strain ATCC BAA-1885 / DSM 22778 / Grapes) TaxID=158190 RepID=G8QXG8_SPHPG|nr:ABC transporter substrate-binding protein [Sphaerochaeta pleomorpha]AEV29531.1 ABC-type branched-chain amino acid transport system, periplasmic component [Sphaerochaeta pleomorpha str. Grapes]
MKKRIMLVALLSLLVLGFAFANGSKETQKPIKIAVVGPLTGDFAEYGQGFKNAVELHAKQINAAGGIFDGRQIEIVDFDDKNSGEEAASIAERIAGNKDIVGVVGHFASGVSMAAAPTYEEVGVPEISPSASHPDYSGMGEYIFRNNSLINVEANETLNIASDVFKAKRVAVLAVKTDWGVKTADILINTLAKDHPELEIVGYEEILDGLTDFSSTITKLRSYKPDTIIVCAMYNILGPFANQYRDIDSKINLIGFSNAYSEQLIKLAQEDGNGIALPAIFFHESPEAKVRSFVDDYMKDYAGKIPSSLTAQAYDSLGMFVQAINEAKSADRKAIKDQLYKINYDGVAGVTYFDATGDAFKTFNWLMIKDGKFTMIDKSKL